MDEKEINDYDEKEKEKRIEEISDLLEDTKMLEKAFPNEDKNTLILLQILDALYDQRE